MTACKVNLGHNRDHLGKDPITDQQVEAVIRAEAEVWPVWFGKIHHYDVTHPGATAPERTTVFGLAGDDRDIIRNFVDEICRKCEQECASVVWGPPVWGTPHEGEFVGPEAQKWESQFDWEPDYFTDLDGKPLTAER